VNGTLQLLMVIVCGVPQVAHYIASKVSTFLKQVYRQYQSEDELSDADSLPRRLISPNQYSRSLLSKSEQALANTNSEPLTLRGQVPPANNYGSISKSPTI